MLQARFVFRRTKRGEALMNRSMTADVRTEVDGDQTKASSQQLWASYLPLVSARGVAGVGAN